MPAASYALLPKRAYFLPQERDREHFVAGFLHKSAKMCLYRTSGRRPPPFTGWFVNTVTSGWVGASNERSPFRFHSAVVGFVDRCLSNTRNLAASNKHIAALFLRPIMAKDRSRDCFFGVFEKFETFLSKICAHSERYRISAAGIFEIVTLMETSCFHGHRSLRSIFFCVFFSYPKLVNGSH